jgi:HAD superfamily hydrolase (TIGR01490 family)
VHKTSKKYIAFLDLDKTILSINSGTILVRQSYNEGLLKRKHLHKALFLSLLHKTKLRSAARIIPSIAYLLKGSSVREISALTDSIASNYLFDSIRPGIKEELKYHRSKGAELVILSSAMLEICRPIGSYLGFDNIISTKMQVKDGRFTGLPEDRFCFEDEKRIQLLEYCKLKGYNTKDAYYYGDSISDLQALEVVGNPVCISPDNPLRKIALVRNWTINDW